MEVVLREIGLTCSCLMDRNVHLFVSNRAEENRKGTEDMKIREEGEHSAITIIWNLNASDGTPSGWLELFLCAFEYGALIRGSVSCLRRV